MTMPNPPFEARRARRSGFWALGRTVIAFLLLAAVVGASAISHLMEVETSRVKMRYQPPQSAFLQRVLWNSPVADTVVRQDYSLYDVRTDTAVFRSVPLSTALVGRSYRYRPRGHSEGAVFELSGAPAGLQVDSATGVISGIVKEEGVFDISLIARIEPGTWVEHRFPLFVDSRFLPLGTDRMGRNVARRLVAATRYSTTPGLIAVLIGVVIGGFLGALAGFYGGPLRRVVTVLSLGIEAVPGLLLLFLVAVVSGFNPYAVMAVIGVLLLPETERGVSERVEGFRKTDFVEAAHELGMRDRTILWGEIVWRNLRPLLLARIAQGFVFAVLAEVTLS